MRELLVLTCIFNIRDSVEVGMRRGEHYDATLTWTVDFARAIGGDEIHHEFSHLTIPNNDCSLDHPIYTI